MKTESKRRLPVLAARSIAEAQSAGQELATTYEMRLFPELSEAGEDVSCRKGCSHCCYHPVYITLLEGAAIYERLVESGVWTLDLKQALQDHQGRVRGLAVEVWMLSLIPCPLLKDDLCTAYERRPFACRVTYSIGAPEDCHPHRLGPGQLPRRDLYEALAEMETKILRRHKLRHFRLPVSTAVLWGERIMKGEVELEDCGAAILEMIDV